MNTNLVAVLLSDIEAHEGDFKARFASAIQCMEEAYPTDHAYVYERPGISVYNRSQTENAWTEPAHQELNGAVLSFSQPPLPTDSEIQKGDYWRIIREICRDERYESLLAGYFGVEASASEVTVWTDYLGLGRCYYISNDRFFAASNHLGALTKFATQPLRVDQKALGEFATVGYFMNDRSPIEGIKHLSGSELIRVSPTSKAIKSTYFDFGELVRPAESKIATREILSQLQTIATNINCLSRKTPRVALSGGNDSRMTSSVWLSAGCDAHVHTIGTLPEEARIAGQLMELFDPATPDQEVSYKITYPKSNSVTMPFDERLRNAFKMWDGDNNPKTLSQAIRQTDSSQIAIGGMGGEICHGYYYMQPNQLSKMAVKDEPLDELKRRLSNRAISEKSRSALEDALNAVMREADLYDLQGVVRTDYFYLAQKFRRWPRQKVGYSNATLLSAPAFIRASFDLTPQERIDKKLVKELTEAAIPGWSTIPTYKASREDQKIYSKKRALSFQTDPEGFWSRYQSIDPGFLYFDFKRINEFALMAKNDQALPVHESWLNTVIWLDEIHAHVAALEGERVKLESSSAFPASQSPVA